MELHQLRYVLAIARAGNFSRAAEECHVSQPSLSQQILKLEDELGERLFYRSRREARLTPSGEAFVARARRIVQEVESARREISETRNLVRGVLTIGVLPTIAPYFLPRVIGTFTQRYPGVEVVLQEDSTTRLLRLLQSNELELALVSLPLRGEPLQIQELFKEELLVVLPSGHRLAKKSVLRIADLRGARLIVMQDGHCLGDQVLEFCDRTAFRPKISFRSAQLETVKALVRAGLGFSLIPLMAAGAESGLEYRSLGPPRPQRSVVAVWPIGRPPGRAAAEFLSIATGQAPVAAAPLRN